MFCNPGSVLQDMVQTPTEFDTGQIPLMLPPAIHLRVSHEQFQALAETNRELRLERTSSGELIADPPAGWESGERNFNLMGQLARWYETHTGLGKAFDSSIEFTLPNGAVRSPDVAWISAE